MTTLLLDHDDRKHGGLDAFYLRMRVYDLAQFTDPQRRARETSKWRAVRERLAGRLLAEVSTLGHAR